MGKLGIALPGRVTSVAGAIVKVNFNITPDVTLPTVQLPVFGPEYIRYPIQVGSLGVCLAIDAYIGSVSGLGTASNTQVPQGNLSNLVWLPIGNKNWTVPPGSDGNTLALYGENALLLLDSLAGNCSVKLTSTGVTITVGSNTVTVTSSSISMTDGANNVTVNSSGTTMTAGSSSVAVTSAGVGIIGVFTINGKPFLLHDHIGVTTGTGTSGVVGP